MDRTEHKAYELMRNHAIYRKQACETCANNSDMGCKVTPDKKSCVYNNYELWKPDFDTFLSLAKRILAAGDRAAAEAFAEEAEERYDKKSVTGDT